jgi:exosortase/archaeosortase family protein
LKKFIITLGIRIFLLYALYLLLFKGLNYIFPAYDRLILGLDELILNNLLNSTTWFLAHIGNITVSHNADTLYFNDQYTMQITQNCLGIKLMYIFAMLIIAYPGSRNKDKIWFIAMGIAILHFLNISRMIALSYVIVYSSYFEFFHGFVFRVLFYGTTFLLWFIWIRKYVDPHKFDEKKESEVNINNSNQ